MTALSTSLLPDHTRWTRGQHPPGQRARRAAARKNWFVRMAQRYHFVPAPDSKTRNRAELARLLTTYVWWQGQDFPAYDTAAQTSNYINRMPWDVLEERGFKPADLPRYTVTLPSGHSLDVLVLARGQKQAEALLAAGLPEGTTITAKALEDTRINPKKETNHDV